MKLQEISTGEAAVEFADYIDRVKEKSKRVTRAQLAHLQAAGGALLKAGFKCVHAPGTTWEMSFTRGPISVHFMAPGFPDRVYTEVSIKNTAANVFEKNLAMSKVAHVDWDACEKAFHARDEATKKLQAAAATIDKLFA